MGKMKEKFIDEMNEHGGFPSDADYQDYLYHQKREGYTSATQEEIESNNQAWWNSLTEEQKERLFNEAKASEDFFNNKGEA